MRILLIFALAVLPLPAACAGGRLIYNAATMQLDCVGATSSASIGFADGTATAPSIHFTTQNTLGFFKQAPNVIGVSRDMALRWDDTSGNIITITPGIGIISNQQSAGTFSVDLKINGESVVRSSLLTSGLKLGGGAGALDTGIERVEANVLRIGIESSTDDVIVKIIRVANGAEPACDSTTRGYVVMVQGGAGVADTFRICSKAADESLAWRALY